MIIKPPKPGLGFEFGDLGFCDLVWLGLGVAKNSAHYLRKILELWLLAFNTVINQSTSCGGLFCGH